MVKIQNFLDYYESFEMLYSSCVWMKRNKAIESWLYGSKSEYSCTSQIFPPLEEIGSDGENR